MSGGAYAGRRIGISEEDLLFFIIKPPPLPAAAATPPAPAAAASSRHRLRRSQDAEAERAWIAESGSVVAHRGIEYY